jgi:alpha-L-rhamnosidase
MTVVNGLRCEYSPAPLGLGVRLPRFSWRLISDRRGARQTACRLLVAGSPERLVVGAADRWDSGWLDGDTAVFVDYAGPPLGSRARAWWRVLVRDETGAETASEPAWFETGLLERADWSAQWIGADLVGGPYQAVPCPFLRRRFTVSGPVARARLYLTALGCHLSFLNGCRTADEELSPGWTDFLRRVRVSVHDVTARLQPGENVLGVILGDGWYCGHLEKRPRQLYGERPLLLAQLEIGYADGRQQRVVSDADWRVGFGPLLASDLIMGEEYDARREFPGWNAPGFDDARWAPARVAPDPGVELAAWEGPPIRRQEEIAPVAEPRAGRRGAWIFDLGQNLVGRVRLRVTAPAGATLTLRYAERLEADGSLYTANLRTARATDHYTCRGGGMEEWEPSFTFHGFQYVEVSGLKAAPSRDALTGVVLHSDWTPAGDFECSHPLVNRLFRNVVWSWKGNSLDLPTDCPQRDERLGWTGDAQVFVGTAAGIADVNGFFAKWLRDLREHQGSDGAIPGIVPFSHLQGPQRDGKTPDGGPGWADAMVVCAWTMYERYGDLRLLREHWPALERWLAQQERTSRDGLRAYPGSGTSCYGDWLALDAPEGAQGPRGATPHDLIGCAWYAHALDLATRIARALGETAAQDRYARLHAAAKANFQRHFLTPAGRLVAETQTAAVLALHFDLVPDELRPVIADWLEADIRRRGRRLSTGFLGTPFIQPVLTREGRLETAAALLFQTAWPSWLYAVTQGATTIWERWDGWTAERGFQNPGMNSFNHYAYGAVGEWLIAAVAGIAPDPAAPGRPRFRLRPCLLPGLDHARARLDTPWGRVESAWRRTGEGLAWEVAVPANAAAVARIPCRAGADVRADGQPLAAAPGVTVLGPEPDGIGCQLVAGCYRFSC